MSDPNEPEASPEGLPYPELPDDLDEWAAYPDIFARVMHHAVALGHGYLWLNEGLPGDRFELLDPDEERRIIVPMSSIRSDPAQAARGLWLALKSR